MNIIRPTKPCGTGVLVLSGSSGRIETPRAELFARHGALALPLQWFGGPGQQPGPWEVPIETFTGALDALAPEVDRLSILGVSFGAEAALVTATHDARVDVVAALAPSSVIWAGHDGTTWTSHWTHRGTPLPYLPIHPQAATTDGPPSHLATFEHSLTHATPQQRAAASIAVERITTVLVASGGDDQVWPAHRFATDVVARREAHGLPTTHVHHPAAGHRLTFPGESAPADDGRLARGGTPSTDAELGARVWSELLHLLDLTANPDKIGG